MLRPHDVSLWLYAPDRSNAWPIWDWTSLSVRRAKQPTGSITVSAPFNSWWIAESEILTATAEPGANYLLEFSVRGTLLQATRVASTDMHTRRDGSELVLDCPSLWGDMLKDRLVLDSLTGKNESIGPDQADDVGREYLRRQLTITSAVSPTGYPHLARYAFYALTAAVGANTSSHGSTITYEVDSGKNLLEWALEFAEKYDLRWTIALSGSTITFDVVTPYTIDKTLATTGKLWTPGLSTLEDWGELLDFSTVRNTHLVGDGTSRSWQEDATSRTDYGNKEEVAKVTVAGAGSANQRSAELLAMARQYVPERRIEVAVVEPDWMRFGTDWYPGTAVTVSEYSAWMREAELEVTEVSLDWAAGGEPHFKASLGSVRRDDKSEGWRLPGPPGGFGAGSRFADKNV